MAARSGWLTGRQRRALATIRRVNARERAGKPVGERDRRARERAHAAARLSWTQTGERAAKARATRRQHGTTRPLPAVEQAERHYSREWNYVARVKLRAVNPNVAPATKTIEITLASPVRLAADDVYARLDAIMDEDREDTYYDYVATGIQVIHVYQAPSHSVPMPGEPPYAYDTSSRTPYWRGALPEDDLPRL